VILDSKARNRLCARIGEVMKAVDTPAKEKISALSDAVGKTIKGKKETIGLAIVALS